MADNKYTLTTNDNRKVKIMKSNTSSISKKSSDTSTDDGSWRYNLSRILSNSEYTDKPNIFTDSSVTDKFIVDPRIDLLMSSNLPKFGSNNNYTKPLDGVIKGLSGLGKAANVISAIGGTNLVQGFMNSDFKDENGNFSFQSAWNDAISAVKSGSTTNVTTATFQPWVQNIEAWNGAQGGISFDYVFNFSIGQYGLWNAKEEVVKPIINLITPSLPQHINSVAMNGPYPNALNLISNMINDATSENSSVKNQWESVKTTFNEVVDGFSNKSGFNKFVNNTSDFFSNLGSMLETLVESSYIDFVYDVSFGKIVKFKKMMMRDVKWSFSTEVDQFGWPISGQVTVTFRGNIPLSITSSDSSTNLAVRFGEGID